MKLLLYRCACCAWLLALALAGPATAHEGHDHGDEQPVATLTPLAPRTEASSELFELVAVLDGGQLLLWLDRFDSNAPVSGARIEVEGQGWKAVASAGADGGYRAVPPQALGPGSHALVFTVQAGADADLLEATLQVPPAAAAAPGAQHAQGTGGPGLRRLGAGALLLAALLTLGAALWRWQRRRAAMPGEAA